MKTTLFTAAVVAASLLAFPACDSDSADDGGMEIQTVTVADVPADPGTGRDPNNGQLLGTTGHYTLFSLSEQKIISSGDAPSAADSASSKWDIGFRSTSIIVNGGTSGPGSAAVIVQEGIFEELTEAPQSGYKTDSAEGFAVPAGSGNGWYNYNPQQMLVSPIPGRFLIVRTADGRYAKLRLLSYYRGAPETPNPFSDVERYYTFEYVFQPDGSRKFE